MTVFNANAQVHQHRRDYVFGDGVVLGDAIDAIAAAGLAGDYVLAGQIKIQYALDVCTRCGGAHTSPNKPGHRARLTDYRIDAYGTVCHLCELHFIAQGLRRIPDEATVTEF